MNFFIDFVPEEDFLNKIKNVKANNIILNIYVKGLPAMNINKNVYMPVDIALNYIKKLKESGFKINIMLDTFCFGNKEFTKKGKEIFELLDKLFENEINYVTVTNNFFFNYIKRRYGNVKIIISEYSEVNNVQKIYRYIDNIGADGVKLDLKLSLNLENMKYIKDNFDTNNIYIDTNKLYYNNDIYRDSLNNSLSHYIQEEKWDEAKESISEYKNREKKLGVEKIEIDKDSIKALENLGFNNFWIYYNGERLEEYINKI